MLAYGDRVYIATQYGIEPYRRAFAHRHIADNGGIVCQKNVVGNVRRQNLAVTVDGFD